MNAPIVHWRQLAGMRQRPVLGVILAFAASCALAPSSGLSATFSPDFGGEGTRSTQTG